MGFFNTNSTEGCPNRHSALVVGSCSLCRKTICEDCLGMKNRDKFICRFCLQGMKDGENPQELTLWQKLFGSKQKEMHSMKLRPDEDCHSGVHQKEVIGTCPTCRKSLCAHCVTEKKLDSKPICKECFMTLFQVRDVVKQEEQRKFVGGLKGFARVSMFIVIGFILVFFLLVGILSAVLSFFRLLHPASFDRYDSNWEKGNYSMIISGDIPDLLNEIGERFWYEWWYEYGFRQSYEEWKQDQLEEAMGANEDEE